MIASTPAGAVSFDQVGTGPDLVLIHSLLTDRNVFERVVPVLARTRRVTLVDLPGYGETDLIEVGIARYANLIGGLIEWLSMDPDTTAVLGNGLGGFVGLATAIHHGTSFNRLVVVGAGAGFPDGGTTAFSTMIERVRDGGMAAVLDLAVRRIFTEEYLAAHPDEAAARREVLATADTEAFIRACQTLMELDLTASVGAIANETLIVVGSEDGATPPAMAEDLARRIPGARLEILRGLAHAPQLQDPEAFLAVVTPHLDGCGGT